jgi:hypothetical protein
MLFLLAPLPGTGASFVFFGFVSTLTFVGGNFLCPMFWKGWNLNGWLMV